MTSAWVIGQFLYVGSGISKALRIPVNQLNEPSEVPASLSKIFETDTADTFQRVQLHNQHADSATQIVSNQILFPTHWDDREASRQCCQVPQKGSMPSTRSPKRYDRLLETTHDSWLRGSTVRCNCSQILNLGTTTREKWDQH